MGSTLLVALMASLQLPIVLTKLSYLIDNPWTVSLARAGSAGLILADSLIDRNLGVRPITFVGFSLGSRVIFSCLQELANKGALGLVQNVYLFGSPIVAKKDEYMKARSVVSGRFVNGYAKNDWILGRLRTRQRHGLMAILILTCHRLSLQSHQWRYNASCWPSPCRRGSRFREYRSHVLSRRSYGLPCGNASVIKGGRLVGGKRRIYRNRRPSKSFLQERLLAVVKANRGQDPENHQKRQRELIAELDEARKEVEEKPGKKGFNFFRRKKAEKKVWETYDESSISQTSASGTGTAGNDNGGVLFDIEAIRAELASEQIEVKQLESTLPPMKISTTSPDTAKLSPKEKTNQSPYSWLRGTKSFGATSAPPTKSEATSSLPSLTNGHREDPFLDPHRNDRHDHSTRGSHQIENVEMTFEGSNDPSTPTHSVSSPNYDSDSINTTSQPTNNGNSSRPSLTSTNTMPVGMSTLEHNAWADDDDPKLGKEREVRMSFE